MTNKIIISQSCGRIWVNIILVKDGTYVKEPHKLCVVRTKVTVNLSHGYQKAP